MKELTYSWLKRILTVLVLVTAAFAAYEYIAVRIKGYPREMHLMDQQYRIIPIHLEKRTATHLHITRRDTQRFFIYKIEDLHPMSQWRVNLYPIASGLGRAKELSNSDNHAEQTLVARDRLIEATEKLQAKIEASESDMLVRSLQQKLAANLQKIRSLEASLSRMGVEYDTYESPGERLGLVERLMGMLERITNSDDPTAE
jgi:hypothetical protein